LCLNGNFGHSYSTNDVFLYSESGDCGYEWSAPNSTIAIGGGTGIGLNARYRSRSGKNNM